MKRQIMKSLMAFCAGVMTLFAASSLFVSCTDLETQISDLEDRVTAIENLTANLEELTAKVDALYTLKFQVTAENELQYSFDGGETWTSTGVVVTEGAADINLVDEGDAVTITIGDQSFTIEKPEEIVFEIKSGKLFFESEGSKTVNIRAIGIEDLTVIAQPDGWKAEINEDGQLEITAPDYEDTVGEFDYDTWTTLPAKYSGTGYVKVHACSADGKCMVGKLYVEVTEYVISVTIYGGKYEVSTAYRPVYFGVSLRENYVADAEKLFAAYKASQENGSDEFEWKNVAFSDEPATGDLAELYGAALEVGKEYVLWAIEYQGLYDGTADDLFLAFYSPTAVVATEDATKRSAYDVNVSVDVKGADSYLALSTIAADTTYMIENVLMELSGEGGGGWGPLDTKAIESSFAKTYTEAYNGPLSLVGVESISMAPDTTYALVVLPLDGRPTEKYTEADFVKTVFRTNALAAGGSVNATAEEITEYVPYEGAELATLNPFTELGVKVAGSAEAWKYIYFQWVSKEVYTTEMKSGDPTAVVKYLTDPGNYFATIRENTASFNPSLVQSSLDPEETMVFVAFFVDENDKYGEIVCKELTTDKVEYADITVTYTSNLSDGGSSLKGTKDLEIALTGGTSYKYFLAEVSSYYNMYEDVTPGVAAQKIIFGNYEAKNVADGKVALDLNFGSSYFLAVLPYDANGKPAEEALVFNFDCVFELTELITESSSFVKVPEVKFNLPEMTLDNTGEYNYYAKTVRGTKYMYFNASWTVTTEEGVKVCTKVVKDNEMEGKTDLQLVEALWTDNYYAKDGAGTFDISYNLNATATNAAPLTPTILVSWIVDGKYYFKKVSVASSYKTMFDHLSAAHGNVDVVLGVADNKSYRQLGNINEVQHVVYKIGTSSAAGSFTVTVPKGATGLTFNAVAWKNNNGVTVDIKDGETVLKNQAVAANDGASGNPTYTITATDADKYTVTFDAALTADKVLTFTSTKRVIFWDINSVAPEAE